MLLSLVDENLYIFDIDEALPHLREDRKDREVDCLPSLQEDLLLLLHPSLLPGAG